MALLNLSLKNVGPVENSSPKMVACDSPDMNQKFAKFGVLTFCYSSSFGCFVQLLNSLYIFQICEGLPKQVSLCLRLNIEAYVNLKLL